MEKLKILFVSNFYPPYDRGGYEKHCHEVAIGLQARGHEVFVLTSQYGVDHPVSEEGVLRTLHLECDLDHYNPFHFFTHRPMRERYNDNALLTAIEYFKPDVIMFWGMWMLSRRLPAIAEDGEVPIAYMIEDYWPIDEDVHTWYWNSQANRHLARPLKGLANRLALARLRREGYPPELAFDHVACGSRFLKEEISTVIPAFRQAEVVMCGIDLAPFYENQSNGKLDTSHGLHIAYVG
jgi:glycosyltransferase involved in cell wall biosynthesis